MTVQTQFFNYQRASKTHGLYRKGESPCLRELREYTMKRWGGQNLGSFGNRETIRSGTAPTTHIFGAAWDWRYENPGPGRAQALNEVLPLWIDYSFELGIQAVHDYFGARIWRSDREGTLFDQAWKPQAKDAQMGQPWAFWFHVEIHPDHWFDNRSVEEKLGILTGPTFAPELQQFGLWPLSTNKPSLVIGSKGDAVKYMQGVFNKVGYGVVIDGNFGPLTADVVKWFQGANGLFIDGVVGPKTWAVIDALAGG